MIIIEGPDGCGKTTAAKRICELCPALSYQHMGPPELEGVAGEGYVKWYLDRFGPYVWDRFHLGEVVYGTLGLSETNSRHERRMVRSVLRDRGALVIVMFASDPTSLRHEKAIQRYTPDEILAVNAKFEEIAHQREYCDYSFDVSKFGFPDDVWLKGWLAKWRFDWKIASVEQTTS